METLKTNTEYLKNNLVKITDADKLTGDDNLAFHAIYGSEFFKIEGSPEVADFILENLYGQKSEGGWDFGFSTFTEHKRSFVKIADHENAFRSGIACFYDRKKYTSEWKRESYFKILSENPIYISKGTAFRLTAEVKTGSTFRISKKGMTVTSYSGTVEEDFTVAEKLPNGKYKCYITSSNACMEVNTKYSQEFTEKEIRLNLLMFPENGYKY